MEETDYATPLSWPCILSCSMGLSALTLVIRSSLALGNDPQAKKSMSFYMLCCGILLACSTVMMIKFVD